MGGLTVNDYTMEDSDLTVIFPGGVTMGTSADATVAAYGEPGYQDDEEEYKSYMWYEEDSMASDNMCYIEFDPETDKAISLCITCYE